ncbi:MAG: glucose-6-phosphate isomerase, partial [Fibrobacter sp.]|nr:glucose-6-phosphate isomerase [Fibrobacter sp.]
MSTPRISYNDKFLKNVVTAAELDFYNQSISSAEKMLSDRSGPGNDFLGRLDLPRTMKKETLSQITAKAEEIRSKADVLICVGIGGSYLGAKAAIEYSLPSFDDMRKPRVIFAGHSINSDYLTDLLELVKDRNVAVNVISKSGTTTEPGIAFRVIRQWMENRYGKKEAAQRIIATTDPKKGALRKLATDEGYTSFEIPADVGGRFSVLTPVGLFPIAVAGLDISKLIEGAAEAMDFCSGNTY